MEFLVKWCEWKGCENDLGARPRERGSLFCNRTFHRTTPARPDDRVNSQVAAISLFERLNKDMALVHFEKGLPDCEGIYKAINRRQRLCWLEK